ncbi:peptidase [Bacillus coahuilensis m2-6]|nr:peptidase E [Bacillus coahuilensis]KUP08335.1 peptidase [Bacillus coahuilensis m2-6]
MKVRRQIIAMGGGGFSMEPDNLLLDQYILDQSEKDSPNVCFLATASGDSDGYIERFYNSFQTLNCEPTHLSLFNPHVRDIEGFILEQDIIYVGGGNTKNLLALWREWGIDTYLRTAWENGTILAGLSAGAICWFEQGVTDSYGDGLECLTSLGFLTGSCCPHFDGEKERRPSFIDFIQSGFMQAGYGIDDGVALHFINEELGNCVSSRENAGAYYVSQKEGQVTEDKLEVNYLGER